MGVPVGPGRGSGAGSLVAYSLGITDLDPLPYNLLFERFLNPERVSMPDFDIDFCMSRREKVIDYVSSRYGRDSVGQIATFQNLKARSVIKDVARAMAIPAQEAQRIASLVPETGPGQTATIAEALKMEPKLKARVDEEPQVAELINQSLRLEGLTRHAGWSGDQRRTAARPRSDLQERFVPRHSVRQERCRRRWFGEVRLPRTEDAHRDRSCRTLDQHATG
jgi:DNA polymerase-3 subunit alpha